MTTKGQTVDNSEALARRDGGEGEATVFDCEAHELVQCAQALAQNIEAVPGWSDNADLHTAHCHAQVLIADLPALLPFPAPASAPGDGSSDMLDGDASDARQHRERLR